MKKTSSYPFQRRGKNKYVFDTSSIIVLIETCRLGHVLLKFSEKASLCVPPRVREEFLNGGPSEQDVVTFQRIFSAVPVKLAENLLPYFNFDSTPGEIWVISYALRNPDCCCVIDEEFGRSICNFLKVKFTGAIGIIVELKKVELLSDKDLGMLKNLLRNSDFYLSKELLDELERLCK